MNKIANTILEKIGGPPLVRINRLNHGGAEVIVKQEGLLIGISSGAAPYRRWNWRKSPNSRAKRIVALLPDSGERCLSTWLFE